MSEFKRLGWVQGYATQATSLANNVYCQARGFVPASLEPFVVQLEETAVSITVPYVTLAQDAAEKVLSSVDAQVCSLVFVRCMHCSSAGPWLACMDLHSGAYCFGMLYWTTLFQVDKSLGLIEGIHSKNIATFNGAKDQAYHYVEGTVNQAKALLDPTPYIHWTSDKVATYVNPDKIVDTSFQILDPVTGKLATMGEYAGCSDGICS
jgi:hypothetical protein